MKNVSKWLLTATLFASLFGCQTKKAEEPCKEEKCGECPGKKCGTCPEQSSLEEVSPVIQLETAEELAVLEEAPLTIAESILQNPMEMLSALLEVKVESVDSPVESAATAASVSN